jgi:ATP-dependent RNA helicase RhlE
MTFAALGLPERVTRGVRAAGYTVPTPIQAGAIPLILPGHDLVAAAQTGTGKTAAFLLPILGRLLDGPRYLRALVLVPTRELAAQVYESARSYSRFTGVRSGCVYGGVPIPPQERLLREQGVELLIATPGRLLDLHGRQSVSLEDVEILVLDEADRMVDMGFAPDLRRILRLLPARRQTLMFSATMPVELNRVAHEALHEPKRLDMAPPSKPAPRIGQSAYVVAKASKPALLEALLDDLEDHTAIVFTRTKHGADRLARRLKASGHNVAALHGDRSQSQRERALKDFRNGRIRVLVATDIAARGIDVDDVTHVVNFDVPRAPDDYVHRIGRTGRMDASGEAITLVAPEEAKDFAAIEAMLGKRVTRKTLPGFDARASEPSERGPERRARGGDDARGPRGRERRRGRPEGPGDGWIAGRAARDEVAPRATPSHAGTGNGAASHAAPSHGPRTPAQPDAGTHGRRPRPGRLDRRSRPRM